MFKEFLKREEGTSVANWIMLMIAILWLSFCTWTLISGIGKKESSQPAEQSAQ